MRYSVVYESITTYNNISPQNQLQINGVPCLPLLCMTALSSMCFAANNSVKKKILKNTEEIIVKNTFWILREERREEPLHVKE